MGEEAAAPAAPETTIVPAAPPSAAADLGVGAPDPVWHEGKGFSSDTVALMEAKGWHKADDPIAEMSKGYANLERLRGVKADQLVRIPEPGNDEQAAEFYTRLGVPETAEGYESPTIAVGGEALDPAPIAAISHALKLTPAQHTALMQQTAALVEAAQTEQHNAMNARLSAEKAEWEGNCGAELEASRIAAGKGFNAIGWDRDTVDAVEAAIGYKAVMNLGVAVGRMTAESTQPTNDDGVFSMPYGLTREAAREQIDIRGGELMTKARNGDKSAAEELRRLQSVAFHS